MNKVITRQNSTLPRTKNRIRYLLEKEALSRGAEWRDEVIARVKTKTGRSRRITQVLDNVLPATQDELIAFAQELDTTVQDLITHIPHEIN